MTGRNQTGTTQPSTSVPRAAFDGGIDYEIVEGELLPRGPLSRAWDPAAEFL